MVDENISNNVFRKIKFLVLDFDGVMTDNSVYLNENGEEMVRCSRSDGLGIEMVKENDVDVLVLSKEKNKVVQARCSKLMIKSIQSADDKLTALKEEIKIRGLSKHNVCYIGNDVNDIECMEYVGLSFAVKDAHPDIFKIADFTTTNCGGNGAIREVCDKLIN